MYLLFMCIISLMFSSCSKTDSQPEPYVIEADVYEPVDPYYYDQYDDDDRDDHDHHEDRDDGGHGGDHGGGGHGR